MTKLMGELRKIVLAAGSSSDDNKRLFLEIVDSEILTALRENDHERALEILKAILPSDLDPEPVMEKPPQ